MVMTRRERGRRIAELRERRGLSQEECARLCGVSHSGFQKWELGGGIRPDNLRRLAEVLEVRIEQITGEAELIEPFDLAAHIDQRLDEIRDLVTMACEALEQQGRLLAILAGASEGPEQLLEAAAQQLEQASRARAAARSEPAAGRAAERDPAAG